MKEKLPIEYERGFTKFLNCKIDLRNRVFIPRIETEFWIRKTIDELKIENRASIYGSEGGKEDGVLFDYCKLKIDILDMFAGSGCIGIAILKNVKNSFVDFVDIDKRAIEQIKINLKLNKIPKSRYRIYRSNLFEKLKNKYDIIFANPPYVAKERIKEVQPSVLKYEPQKAILAGKKGLFYIRKFFKEARKYLTEKGIIYLEFDLHQIGDIKKILEKEGYKNSCPVPKRSFWCGVKFFKDQFKKYRWVRIISF